MRISFLLTALLVAVPTATTAQPAVLAGIGLTSPVSDFSDVAGEGYHLSLGVQVEIPSLPVGLRLDGSYHRLAAPSSAFTSPRVLGGALDLIFHLPGEGIEPYVLFGVGRYRVDAGPAATSSPSYDGGLQTGFGVDLGSLAFGAFAEIRIVHIRTDPNASRYLPLTVGLRM